MENLSTWFSCDSCNPNADPLSTTGVVFVVDQTDGVDFLAESGWLVRGDGDFCPLCSKKLSQAEGSFEPEGLTLGYFDSTPEFGEVAEELRDDRPEREQEAVHLPPPTDVPQALQKFQGLFKNKK